MSDMTEVRLVRLGWVRLGYYAIYYIFTCLNVYICLFIMFMYTYIYVYICICIHYIVMFYVICTLDKHHIWHQHIK